MLETSRHLYQPPLFKIGYNSWFSDFEEALKNAPEKLTLDIPAIYSFLSFGYICGDRTLFQEIMRRPWLSEDYEDGHANLLQIPKHGFLTADSGFLAKRFFNLLTAEARSVVNGYSNIYVLLTGGLDSRIVAGVRF